MVASSVICAGPAAAAVIAVCRGAETAVVATETETGTGVTGVGEETRPTIARRTALRTALGAIFRLPVAPAAVTDASGPSPGPHGVGVAVEAAEAEGAVLETAQRLRD